MLDRNNVSSRLLNRFEDCAEASACAVVRNKARSEESLMVLTHFLTPLTPGSGLPFPPLPSW